MRRGIRVAVGSTWLLVPLLVVTPGLAPGASAAPAVAQATGATVVITSAPSRLRPGNTATVTTRVPVGSRCRLTLSEGGHIEARSSPATAPGGLLDFTWTVPVRVTTGYRTATVACQGSRTAATMRIGVIGNRRGKATTSAGSIRALGVTDHEPPGAKALGATGYPAYGTVLVPAGQWFGGHGVNVISNGFNDNIGQHGADNWQCVELTNRFLTSEHFGPSIYGNAGPDYWANATNSAYERHPNGSGYTPVPGDIIVLAAKAGYGHVEIVDAVSGGTIYTVEQNASSSGRSALSLNGSTIGGAYTMSTIGTIHARANAHPTGGNPGGGPAPGSGPQPPVAGPNPPRPTPDPPGSPVVPTGLFSSEVSFADASGNLHLFALSSGGINHYEKAPGSAWGGEIVTQGQFSGISAFIDPENQELHLFGLTSGGVNHYAKLPNTPWGSEIAATGQFSQITAFIDPKNEELHLFALSTGGINHYGEAPNTPWGGEIAATGQFSQISAFIDSVNEELHLFALSTGGVNHYAELPNTPWGSEIAATGQFSQITAFIDPKNEELHLFALSTGGINHYGEAPNTPWGGEIAATGQFSQISAFIDSANEELHLFALSTGGVNHYAELPNTPWGSEIAATGQFSQIASFLDATTDDLQLFAISSGGVNHYARSTAGPWGGEIAVNRAEF